MSNEIVKYFPVNELQTMAEAIAKSGLFGMKEPTQALALMLTAQAEGQHPATITQDYDIIQNKAARKTHSVLARFQQAGGKVEWHELNETKAKATFTHPSGGALQIEWTIAMAQRAGLAEKDNWRKYPRAMLRARCIAEGIRAVYPAAIGGALLVEEAQDLDPIDVTPTGVTVEQPKARSESASPAASASPLTPANQPTSTDGGGTGAKTEAEHTKDYTEAFGEKTKADLKLLQDGQKRILRARLKSANLTELDLEAKFGKLDELPFSQFDAVQQWAATRA